MLLYLDQNSCDRLERVIVTENHSSQIYTIRKLYLLGRSEKNFFWKSKKSSSQIRPNGQKLVKNLLLGGYSHFLACYPPKCYWKR